MKNNILIHKNYSYSKLFVKFILALIPLVLYGLYKNGILLYVDGNIKFIELAKPILFPLIGLLIGLLVNYLVKKTFSFNPLMLYGMLVGMIVPISTNILLFTILLFGLLYGSTFLEKKVEFNVVCLIKSIMVGVLLILNSYEYANISELNSTYAISIIDILFGRGIGGICSTSVILIICGFIYLLTDYYYKKEISLSAIVSYILVCLISYFFVNDFNLVLNNLITAAPLFAFVFIAPLTKYSSATIGGKFIFGAVVGILTGCLMYFVGVEAPIIAILIVSLAKNLIDKLTRQKSLK